MQKQKNGQKKSAFLLKTYDILQNNQYQDIVSWHYDGIGFVINNIQKFTENILPLYFKHSNFASFIRQLNMYGFSKKRSSKSENYYHHIKFQKNQKDMIRQIQRKMQKKSNRNDQKNNGQHQEIKISSQLSIQLQSRNDVPRRQEQVSLQTINKNKLISLVNFNQQLINMQKNSLIQILKDLNALKNVGASQLEQLELEKIFQQYLEAHLMYFNQIKQKVLMENKQNDKLLATHSKLQTQQTLRDKKQGESKKKQKIVQKNTPIIQKTKNLEQI